MRYPFRITQREGGPARGEDKMQDGDEAAGVQPPDPLTEHLRNAAVLVVDDEPGMRNFLVKTLRPHCRKVVEAADDASLPDRDRLRALVDGRVASLFNNLAFILAAVLRSQ